MKPKDASKFKILQYKDHFLDGSYVRVVRKQEPGYVVVEVLEGPSKGAIEVVHLLQLRPGLRLVS